MHRSPALRSPDPFVDDRHHLLLLAGTLLLLAALAAGLWLSPLFVTERGQAAVRGVSAAPQSSGRA